MNDNGDGEKSSSGDNASDEHDVVTQTRSDSIVVQPSDDLTARARQEELELRPRSDPPPALKRHALISTLTYRGPLPHPEHLRQYDDVLPGGADRIVTAWETESKHRRGMEERALSGELYRQTTGQWLGFSIVSLALGAATYCAVIGQTAVACTIGALDLVGLAAVFVAGKFFERRSSEQSVARSEKDDE